MSAIVRIAAAVLLLLGAAASAGPGHDHDHGPAAHAATGHAPRRLPDGSVFLPKPTQRQLAVRTVVAEVQSTRASVELLGRIVMDPNAGGRVQPTQAGRLEAGPRGLPSLGQRVRRGEVLAVVRASASAIERANQQAQAAELRAQLELARRRVQRLVELEGTVPLKDLEAARSDVGSLQQRLAAVGASVSASETLVAPVSGIVSASHAVAGQVVDARELLFEIVDPSRLVVEALVFDPALLSDLGEATASPAPGLSLPLRPLGAGRAQREGAVPLQFRIEGAAPPTLAVNQPVKVLVRARAAREGIPVPLAAVVKDTSNRDVVWTHPSAEVFQPRPVRLLPLDGTRALVVDGLAAGDRVVVQGAALVNQVR